jgi:hypothetical protein
LSPFNSINRKKCLKILQNKFNITIRIFKLSSNLKSSILDKIFKSNSDQLEKSIDIIHEPKENIYLLLMNRELSQNLKTSKKNADFQHSIKSNHKKIYDDYLNGT